MILVPAPSTVIRFFILGVLLISVSGCGRPPTPEEPPPIAPVKWNEARQLFIQEWTDLVGTTQPLPQNSARVSAAVEGRVQWVLHAPDAKPLSEGQWLTKGTVIVQLDASIAQAKRDQVEAAQADLQQQVKQAELVVQAAELDLRAKQELNKKSSPGSEPLVAPIEMEKTRVALEDARLKLRGAQLRVEASAKELKALNDQLHFYTLTAPIDGRLGRIMVQVGQTLSVGTPVAEVINIENEIDLLCFIPPKVLRKLKERQTAQIGSVDEMVQAGAKAASTTGKVVFIADQGEMDTGNFAVKVRFPNQSLRWRGNTTLRIRVQTSPGKACLTLPESAIQEDQDPPRVIAVENPHSEVIEEKETEVGVARVLRVKTGIHDRVNRAVEVISVEDPEKKWHGDLETTKFVIEKGNGLRSGDRIKLEVEEDEEAAPGAEKKD
jgi:multidrug efflux system membrane fusion protein